MRTIDEAAIKAHADVRFRSEYDYALFEYYRSAKVFASLERAGVTVRGRVLDAGCGGGGMPLSFAEEADMVVGIDPVPRFREAGVRLARERGIRNLVFAQADGMYLPFRD
ncbi:MAG TPA: methyltransferase domain-containing protein, partial [Vicinamibacterales bacterium]